MRADGHAGRCLERRGGYDMMVVRMEKKIDVLCDVRLRVMLDIVSET